MSKPRNTPSAASMKRDMSAIAQAAERELVQLDAVIPHLPGENELAAVLIGQRQQFARVLRMATTLMTELDYVPVRVAPVKASHGTDS